MYHNVQNLGGHVVRHRRSARSIRARRSCRCPTTSSGRLVQFIVAHEVGHTLGFRHNMRASSMYSIEQIRDKNWVRENGHTPSIMDYARFNYVAQPEDGIPVDDLMPKIGPYDKWATMWGYKPIPDGEDTRRREGHAQHLGARAGDQAVPAVHDLG